MSDASVTIRPLRPDLMWVRRANDWLVHDPLTESYYLFDQAERDAAIRMSRDLTEVELLAELTERHANVDRQWLRSLCLRMRGYRLFQPAANDVVSSNAGESTSRSRQRWALWLNPLSIRIPICNPQPALARLKWLANILFHPGAVAALCVLMIAVSPLVLQRLWFSNSASMASLHTLSGSEWLLLGILYLIAKSLHELGHGLACIRQKVECNELGIMLLVFAPCLYCDTSSAWRLTSKWRRASIAAAGIYVELWIAVLSSVVWLCTRPGFVHDVSGGLMGICSLSTLLINGNPLLKYDGYYILSDLTETVNLSERARASAKARFRNFWYRGDVDHRDTVWLDWLAFYGWLSAFYRCGLLIAIFVVLWYTMAPNGFGLVVVGLALPMLAGLGFSAARSWKVARWTRPAPMRIRWLRIGMASLFVLACVYTVYFVPLANPIHATARARFYDTQDLIAPRTAVLEFVAASGSDVQSGLPLIRLHDESLASECLSVESDLRTLSLRVQNLDRLSAIDESAAIELEVAQEQHRYLKEKFAILNRESRELVLQAEDSGTFFPAIHRRNGSQLLRVRNDNRLVRHLSNEHHTGLRVDRGQYLGRVADLRKVELEALISPEDVRRVKSGANVYVQWVGDAGVVLKGHVVSVAAKPTEQIPTTLQSCIDSELGSGGVGFKATRFPVVIRFDGGSSNVLHRHSAFQAPRLNEPAMVRIEAAKKTLAKRLWDSVLLHLR